MLYGGRDREAAESLMQLRQGFLGEMHRKKIAATYSTPPTTGEEVTTPPPERSVSVIVSPVSSHQYVPISVVQPQTQKDGRSSIEAASIGERSRGISVLSQQGLRVSRHEEDEGVRRTMFHSLGGRGESVSSSPVSIKVNRLDAVARTGLELRNFNLDLPGPSFPKEKTTQQQPQSPLELVSSNVGSGSYPKKKDFFSRSPPLTSATHCQQQFSFERAGIPASQSTQPFVHSDTSSFSISEQQQQQLQQQQQRLVVHNKETPWLSIPYRPMNLGPSSSHVTFLPGTTLIRFSDPGAAQQLSSRNANVSRDIYGGDVEWRQQKQGMYENQRIKQIKSKKKVFRALIQINGDTSQPIIIDGFTIQREAWAKAFLQTQICHSAAILFKAIFTPDEIQNCTLAGRNGTSRLDLKKRAAIFRAVGWMKNKNQNPYSFDSAKPSSLEFLTEEEKMMIEKKVFVERRYQTSRKIKPNSERVNSLQLKRPAAFLVEPYSQKFFGDDATASPESTSSTAMPEIDMKPSFLLASSNTMSSINNSETISIPNMSVLNIKQEKEEDPTTGSEEEDPFMKLSSADEIEGLPPKIAKMSTQ